MIRTPIGCACLLAAVSASNAWALTGPGVDQQGLLSFIEPNEGQTTSAYSHVARAAHYTAYLRADEARFMMGVRGGDDGAAGQTRKHTVRMRLLGARADAEASAGEVLAGYSNYLRGRDPERWLTGVAHYRKVQFVDVYPGIDVVYTLEGSGLRYDFVLAPQADTRDIKLDFAGATDMRMDEAGALHVRADGAELVHSAPRIFQEIDGVRRDVAGDFAVQGDGTLRFRVAAHDATSTLVIDPQVTFATYLGGSASDRGSDLSVDSNGRMFVVGQTDSLDFPTVDPLPPGVPGGLDIFVARIAPDGQSLEYATYIGGSGEENPHQIALDASGNVLLAGYTTSSDFPVVNAAQSAFVGGGLFESDGFVTKLASTGDSLVFSTYLGGSGPTEPLLGYEWIRGLTVDGAGNAYVVGETSGSDFPATQEMDGRACMEGEAGVRSPLIGDAFVARFAANGDLDFAVCIGGAERDTGRGIALAADGSIHIVGFTRSDDYPVTEDAFQAIWAGGLYDAHVTRLDADGMGILSATYVGGSETEFTQQVRVAADGSSVVVGESDSPDFPTTQGAFQTERAGTAILSDATVFRVAADASRLLFSTYLGGSGDDGGWGLALDAAGRIYVSSSTSSVDFPMVDATQPDKGGAASLGEDVGPDSDDTRAVAAGTMLLDGQFRSVLVAGNDGVNRLYELDEFGDVAGTTDLGPQASHTRAVALFDADVDGLADAVVAGNDGAPGRVYFADGMGGFLPPVDLAAPIRATRAMVLAQLRASPQADLVVGNYLEVNAFHRGEPTGFGPGLMPFPGSETTATTSLAVGDVNQDGFPDVVEGNDGQPNLVYLGTAGDFLAGSVIGGETDATTAVALADMDGDGDLDLVIGNSDAPNRLYRNAGGGVFDGAEDLDPVPGTTTSLVLDDINFDGMPDVLAADGGAGWAYINDGAGRFARLPLTSLAEPSAALASESGRAHRATPAGAPIRRLNIGLEDAYVAVLDPSGRQLLFSTYLGGTGAEFLEWGLEIDDLGNVYVAGLTTADDFPTLDPLQPAAAGGNEAFVTKLVLDDLADPSPSVYYETTLNLTAPGVDGITRVVFNWSTLACGQSRADQLYDYSMSLYAGENLIYFDAVIVDGILQPLVSLPRGFPFWDFDLGSQTLSQFTTGVDEVIANPGATGVNYLVTDADSLPNDGIVGIAKFDTGEFVTSGGSLLLSQSTLTLAADCDADGVDDASDNCTAVANADQRDTDADGIGNVCDGDLDNDCSVNFIDLGLMKSRFFGDDSDADLNGDGAVNFLDLGIMKSGFFAPPGPSGVSNICEP